MKKIHHKAKRRNKRFRTPKWLNNLLEDFRIASKYGHLANYSIGDLVVPKRGPLKDKVCKITAAYSRKHKKRKNRNNSYLVEYDSSLLTTEYYQEWELTKVY